MPSLIKSINLKKIQLISGLQCLCGALGVMLGTYLYDFKVGWYLIDLIPIMYVPINKNLLENR